MHVASLELCKELYGLSGVVWKPVVGLEDRFIVSVNGEIRSLPSRTGAGKVRRHWENREGYCYVPYKDSDGKTKKIAIHRAIAEAFIINPDNKPHVNHIDGNPTNNMLINLEWVTPGENVEHSRTSGKADRYQNRGEKHGMHKLTKLEVIYIREHTAMTARQLREMFNVSDQIIRDIWSGRRWSHVR